MVMHVSYIIRQGRDCKKAFEEGPIYASQPLAFEGGPVLTGLIVTVGHRATTKRVLRIRREYPNRQWRYLSPGD